MKTEAEILDAAVRIIRVYRRRIRELEERVDNLLEALSDADEYIEELEEATR